MRWPCFSTEEELRQVESLFSQLVDSPENRTLLLYVLRSHRHLDQGFTAELAKEAMRKLSPELRNYVEGQSIDHEGVRRDGLWKIIVWAFSIVLVGAFLGITAIAILQTIPCFGSHGSAAQANSATAQILLTVFTTTVGFLSGLFSPSPLEQQRRPVFRSQDWNDFRRYENREPRPRSSTADQLGPKTESD